MDKITIIIPIYKVEKYLQQCIDSIINQTYKNLEIILVDDGSPDRCGLICDNYAAKDHRIVVIHQDNKGVSEARNAGLEVAKGEYVAFIDSDDYIDSRMIEVLHENLITYKAQISCCEFVRVYAGKSVSKVNQSGEVYELSAEQALSKYLISSTVDVISCNKLYDIRLFSNIRFPAGRKFEDHYVTYRLLASAEKIVHCKEQLYYYRMRSGSISVQTFSVESFDLKEGLDEACRYIKAKYPAISRQIDLGYVRWLVVLYNMMVKGNCVDAEYLKFVRKWIWRIGLDIILSPDFSIVHKVQCTLLLLNKKLYACLYKKYISSFRHME